MAGEPPVDDEPDFMADDVDAPVHPALTIVRSKKPHAKRVEELKLVLRGSTTIAFTGEDV